MNERSVEELTASAHAIIDEAIELHHPRALYGLFSGGHDSLTTSHVISQHPFFSGEIVHIDTTIGIPETRQFVRDVCETYGWTLDVRRPNTTYLMLLVKYGFPAPPAHNQMYSMLKERPLRTHQRDAKKGGKRTDKIAYASGVRSQESERRMGHVEPIVVEGSRLWVAPIHDWSADDCRRYMVQHGLPRNPVKDRMHISGECLCGCYAGKEERHELEIWYPHVAEELSNLERIVQTVCATRAGGVELPPWKQRWGYKAHKERRAEENVSPGPMCQNCTAARPDMFDDDEEEIA